MARTRRTPPTDAPETEPAVLAPGEFRNRVVGLEYVLAGDLAVHPKNWRLHPENQRSALAAALDKIGVADAALAYKSERNHGALTLIDGHLRRDLMQQQMPVLILDLTDDEADLLLASHDVITTMADRDEKVLAELIDGIESEIPRDLLIAIDPDLPGWEYDPDKAKQATDAAAAAEGSARYPIIPEFDEGYDSVIIFATNEADWNWLEKELKLPAVRDRSRIGTSHVLTVAQFRERWGAK